MPSKEEECAQLHWASSNEQQPSFCNPLIYLNLSKLNPTPETIAAIFGIRDPDTITLREKDSEKTLSLEGEKPAWPVKPESHYEVHVSSGDDDSKNVLDVPINKIFPLFPGATDDEKSDRIQKLSENFYTKIWNDPSVPDDFRNKFVSRTSSDKIQAFRQFDWFHEIFGGPSMMAGRKDVIMPKVLAKHTSSRMTKEHAITWLVLMEKSLEEEFPTEEKLKSALERYWLHFYGFFPYSDEDRKEFRRVVYKT